MATDVQSKEQVKLDILEGFTPQDIPDLVSFWNFTNGGSSFITQQGEDYILESQSGDLEIVADAQALGGTALRIENNEWLNIARKQCPRLDVHGPQGQVSVVAWIKRSQEDDGPWKVGGCEFIAGQWNETDRDRQYGLFLNISVWGEYQQVTGHLSNVGGPTPGFKYCVDGPVGAERIQQDEWKCVAMSYDGQCGYVWVDGVLDSRPGLNPYSMAGGLHDGGENGSDFTVGAVDRSGVIGNHFHGLLAGLAVYDRALSPGEFSALNQLS